MNMSEKNQLLGRFKGFIDLLVPLPFAFASPVKFFEFVEPVVPDRATVVVAESEFLADKEIAERQLIADHLAAGGAGGNGTHATGKDFGALLASLIDLLLGHGRICKERPVHGSLSLFRHRWPVRAQDNLFAMIAEGFKRGYVTEDLSGSSEHVVFQCVLVIKTEPHSNLLHTEQVKYIHGQDAGHHDLDPVIDIHVVVYHDEVGRRAERQLVAGSCQLDK